jgi:hypothetical protein
LGRVMGLPGGQKSASEGKAEDLRKFCEKILMNPSVPFVPRGS